MTSKRSNSAIRAAVYQVNNGGAIWTRKCLYFVENCFKTSHSSSGGDARSGWFDENFKHPGVPPGGYSKIPRGVPVWWDSGDSGHVALSTGDGRCISTDYVRGGHADFCWIEDITNDWGPFYGWSEDIVTEKVYDGTKDFPTGNENDPEHPPHDVGGDSGTTPTDSGNPNDPERDPVIHTRWHERKPDPKPVPISLPTWVRMSASGSIRLSQIAAYDADGNVKPVRFHVGVYNNSGVNSGYMPMMSELKDENPDYVEWEQPPTYNPADHTVPQVLAYADDKSQGVIVWLIRSEKGGLDRDACKDGLTALLTHPDADPGPDPVEPTVPDPRPDNQKEEFLYKLPRYLHPIGGDNYKADQKMPFFEGAFETITPDGTVPQNNNETSGDAGMAIGWGNFYEPAGYWPGRFSRGAERTGLLVDETSWSYDLSSLLSQSDRDSNLDGKTVDAGMISVMIYCDDSDEPTYFMGRFLRQEPGAS